MNTGAIERVEREREKLFEMKSENLKAGRINK